MIESQRYRVLSRTMREHKRGKKVVNITRENESEGENIVYSFRGQMTSGLRGVGVWKKFKQRKKSCFARQNSKKRKQTRRVAHNEQPSSYRYLRCCVAVCSRPEKDNPPPPLHLRHDFTVAEAKQCRDAKSLNESRREKRKKFFVS
jgi:isochorismate synthase EntC